MNDFLDWLWWWQTKHSVGHSLAELREIYETCYDGKLNGIDLDEAMRPYTRYGPMYFRRGDEIQTRSGTFYVLPGGITPGPARGPSGRIQSPTDQRRLFELERRYGARGGES
jgi:hypothetical protein